jgi:predicted nucleotidyltransferase
MRTIELYRLLPKDVAERLLAFKRDVMQALPGAVEDVVLFGSRARGDAHEESDYDIAVLLRDRLADDRDIQRRVSDVSWDYVVEGLYIQAIPMHADALRPAVSDFAMRVAADGVPLR